MTSSTEMKRVPQWRLWFGLAAPVIAWTIHGLTSVIVAASACGSAWLAVARGVLIAVSLGALATSIAGGLVAFGTWRRLASARLTRTEAKSREEMMALGGIWVGVVFTLGILWGGLPAVLLVDVCEVLR